LQTPDGRDNRMILFCGFVKPRSLAA
jgi:hypothetical protein